MNHLVITINRLYGSNGRRIGRKLAEKLGIHFYDKELISLASEKQGMEIPYEELLKVDEKRASMWRYPVEDDFQMNPKFRFEPMNDVLFQAEIEVIREVAQKEDCVIVGRCANHILGDGCKSLFIHAPIDYRVKIIMDRASTDEKNARLLIKKMDKERQYFYNYYTDKKWLDMSQYDLCINSERFEDDQIVTFLTALYNKG